MKQINTDLIVILGPTASGKTALAAALAYKIDAQIISADSRQVYKGMNVGTGKDLHEYVVNEQKIPVNLIDIRQAGEQYSIADFQVDFSESYSQITKLDQIPILCGGSGLYIQSVLSDFWQTQIPKNDHLISSFDKYDIDDLIKVKNSYKSDLVFDISTRKRTLRAIEILEYLKNNVSFVKRTYTDLECKIFGLNPATETRRNLISDRLKIRIEKQGLIEEVKGLIDSGLSHEQLIYYGLEYKYITYFLQNKLTYNEMFIKLQTEIHRFAKRQMTFFRSLEKKGFEIDWLDNNLNLNQKVTYIRNRIALN